jgi:hypothetical protein
MLGLAADSRLPGIEPVGEDARMVATVGWEKLIGSQCRAVYPLLVTGLGFVAVIVNAPARPATVGVAAVLLRREPAGAFHRIQTVKFSGGKATLADLVDYEKMIAAAADSESAPNDGGIAKQETEFSVLEAVAEAAPREAFIKALGLLEYQLKFASERIAPDQPPGWPQVTRNLDTCDKWSTLYLAAMEFLRLRDHTVRSTRPPSNAVATRYVSAVQDLVTTFQASPPSLSDARLGGGG